MPKKKAKKKNINWAYILHKEPGFQSFDYSSPFDSRYVGSGPPLRIPLDHALTVKFHMMQGEVELVFRKSPQNKKNLYKLAVLTVRNILAHERKLLKLPKPKKA